MYAPKAIVLTMGGGVVSDFTPLKCPSDSYGKLREKKRHFSIASIVKCKYDPSIYK
jgi:hypothetical protein